MKMSKRSKIVIYALLGLVALYFLAPFIYMLFSAFKTESEAIAYPPKLFPTEWHFENFINAWKSQPFGTYLLFPGLGQSFPNLQNHFHCHKELGKYKNYSLLHHI